MAKPWTGWKRSLTSSNIGNHAPLEWHRIVGREWPDSPIDRRAHPCGCLRRRLCIHTNTHTTAAECCATDRCADGCTNNREDRRHEDTTNTRRYGYDSHVDR